jgi:hypothetical protein
MEEPGKNIGVNSRGQDFREFDSEWSCLSRISFFFLRD